MVTSIGALEHHEKGLDFADALRSARSVRASAFVTFDQRLAKRAQCLGLIPKNVGLLR